MKHDPKPTRAMSLGWAVRAANQWLARHGFIERATGAEPIKPCDSLLIHTRPPTFCAAAWFGSAGSRRALCEVRRPLFSPADIIIAALRKPRRAESHSEPKYNSISPANSRRRVLRAIDVVIKMLRDYPHNTSVEIYGRWNVESMSPWSISIHGNDERPDPATYERELLAVRGELEKHGYRMCGGYEHCYSISR